MGAWAQQEFRGKVGSEQSEVGRPWSRFQASDWALCHFLGSGTNSESSGRSLLSCRSGKGSERQGEEETRQSKEKRGNLAGETAGLPVRPQPCPKGHKCEWDGRPPGCSESDLGREAGSRTPHPCLVPAGLPPPASFQQHSHLLLPLVSGILQACSQTCLGSPAPDLGSQEARDPGLMHECCQIKTLCFTF